MKRKRQLIGAILLAVVVSGGVYAYGALTDTITADVAVAGAEIATVDEAAAQPDWNSVLTPVVDAEIFRPNAAGDETDISEQEPTSDQHWDKVDEEIADGDTTYVATNTEGWQEDLYNIADHSTLTAAGTILYVKVYTVVRATDTPEQSSAYVHIKTNGVEHNGPETTMTTGYATYSYQWNTNPQTGYAWTWDEIDALQIGVGLRQAKTGGSAAGQYTRCTQVYVEVVFTAPPLSGDVPTGDLFDITPHTNYTGDLTVRVYLTNTGALAKAYQELNTELKLEGSVEYPDYQPLTLENGWVTFNLKDYAPGTYTLSVTGGDYSLVSRDTSEWQAGWTVIPELYCQIFQRGE